MTKYAFLCELREKLSGMPEKDIERFVSQYSMAIDEGIKSGKGEEGAVAGIGSTDDALTAILEKYPLAKVLWNRFRPRRRLKWWEILCIIAGSPLILAGIFAVFFAAVLLYVCIGAVITAFWAMAVLIALSAVGCLVEAVVTAVGGKWLGALASFGIFLVLGGIGILSVLLCLTVTSKMLGLSHRLAIKIKRTFLEKGAQA